MRRAFGTGQGLLLCLLATLPAVVALSEPTRTEPDGRGYQQEQGTLIVSFLDVGLGDAALVRCPDNKTQILIDAGDLDNNYPNVGRKLLTALQSELGDDRTIEWAIASHFHIDHVGGFFTLLDSQKYQITNFVGPDLFPQEAELERSLPERLRQQGTLYHNRLPTPALCPNSTVVFRTLELPAEANRRLGCPANLNDCSLKLRIDYQGAAFILLADAGKTWDREALNHPDLRLILSANVLKVPHHGSDYALSSALLSAISPEFAVISAGKPNIGKSNLRGYPGIETTQRLVSYLNKKLPEHSPAGSLAACRRQNGICLWQEINVHPHLFSTQRQGTISFAVRNGRIYRRLP